MFLGTSFPYDGSSASLADALAVADAVQTAIEGFTGVSACVLTPVILTVAETPPPAGPAWQVTGGATSESSPVIHLTGAETGLDTIGLTVLLVTRSGDASQGITGITDNAGSTWTRLTTGDSAGDPDTCVESWTTDGLNSDFSAISTVTIASPAAQNWSWNIHQWDIDAPGTPLIRFDTASPGGSAASGTTIDTPGVSPTYVADLVIAAGSWPLESATLASAGWTALDNFDIGSAQSGRAAYIWPGSTASLHAEWTLGVTRPAGVLTVALLGPPAAPPLKLNSSDWALYTAAITPVTPGVSGPLASAFLATRSPADGILASGDITSLAAALQSAVAALGSVTACSVAQSTISPSSV